jgi:hypothetical protein
VDRPASVACAVCRRPVPAGAASRVRVETRGHVGAAWVEWPVCVGPCEAVARARAEAWVGPIEKATRGWPA